jgi:glycosyltransferase involved in cell wall biosynthesis
VSPVPLSWVYRREARTLAAFEIEATRRAVTTLVVTGRERDTLAAMVPGARIEVLANGVDVESLGPRGPATASSRVVFCGVMNYPPNVHAATLLAREVWPRVRAAHPNAILCLVGADPVPAVRALASPVDGIEVTGSVPDVRPYLWGAAVAAAPLVTARGIQNKVLEAVAAGLPTVVTPNVAAALPPEVAPAVVSASGPGPLATAIISLLSQTPADRRALAERASVAALAWDRQLAPLEGVMRSAATRSATTEAHE